MKKYTYLALGDSYTIGEQVLPDESFPYQTVELLNAAMQAVPGAGMGFSDPHIIAKTGWTTDELDAAINAAFITTKYDIVTLLIGVNNQYRGRSVSEYKIEFEQLLQRAIGFAGNKNEHVFVLSIPDWGITPFADGRDREEIAKQLDTYNAAAKDICQRHAIVFIDITTLQRRNGNKDEYLASDKLHPSGKEYAGWAAQLADAIKK